MSRGRLAVAAALMAGSAFTVEASDPALERRVMRIANELRCLVCQNQTIADSQADLAVDLRRQVREMLQRGERDARVIDFMTQRYGDFVLYRPPFKASTVFLWGGPFLFLLFGIWFLIRRVREQALPERQLSEADRARAAKLLE